MLERVFGGISNEEFTWDRKGLTNESPVCGPSEKISTLEVCALIGKMKQGKLSGPTWATSETGTLWKTDVCNDTMHIAIICYLLEKWQERCILV